MASQSVENNNLKLSGSIYLCSQINYGNSIRSGCFCSRSCSSARVGLKTCALGQASYPALIDLCESFFFLLSFTLVPDFASHVPRA
jgi:hypothetical protein